MKKNKSLTVAQIRKQARERVRKWREKNKQKADPPQDELQAKK